MEDQAHPEIGELDAKWYKDLLSTLGRVFTTILRPRMPPSTRRHHLLPSAPLLGHYHLLFVAWIPEDPLGQFESLLHSSRLL